jgi:hypothetical protein
MIWNYNLDKKTHYKKNMVSKKIEICFFSGLFILFFLIFISILVFILWIYQSI